jgi:NAD(P)-dependent dehydrogenase (short-subunit alcohol dehydrogenase family)
MTTAPRVAYVTGGTSGIGLATVGALLDDGWQVAICGRDEEKLAAATEQLGAPDRLLATRTDVSQSGDVERWVTQATARFGPPELLVLSAGIAAQGEIAILSEHDWNETLAVNLTGPFLVSRAVVPLMRDRGGGYVVAISSIAGKHGMAGISAYSASKFGLIGLAETLLKEEAQNGIRATTICPGWVATPMAQGASAPIEEMIQPEDIARTILWLLDLSSHVVVREVIVERVGSL